MLPIYLYTSSLLYKNTMEEVLFEPSFPYLDLSFENPALLLSSSLSHPNIDLTFLYQHAETLDIFLAQCPNETLTKPKMFKGKGGLRKFCLQHKVQKSLGLKRIS